MSYFDILLAKKLSGGGGGGGITVESLSVNSNGTYTAETGKAYSPVSVSVPNTYTAGDEGKVVSSGALVAQTSQTYTTNDTYDTTLINEVIVNVASGGGGLEYETGEWTPATDTSQCAVTFANSHSVMPAIVAITAETSGVVEEATFIGFAYVNMQRLLGWAHAASSSATRYGGVIRFYRNSSSAAGSKVDVQALTSPDTDTSDTSTSKPRYWCTENGICGKNGNGTDGLFRTTYTYKWIAIWAPTS